MISYRISYPPKIFILSELYSKNELSEVGENKRQMYFDELTSFIEKLTKMSDGAISTKLEVTEQINAFTELKELLENLWKIEKGTATIENKINFMKMIGIEV